MRLIRSRSPSDRAEGAGPAIDARALAALRGDMVRFAVLQLRNRAAAEDVVHEAIEAAIRRADSFEGGASLKTWVFAILRNRIVDHLRQRDRTVSMSVLIEDDDNWQDGVDQLFAEHGGWRPEFRPAAWPNPEQALSSRQFWVVFETCLEHLPEATARVFMMREFLGFETEEICTTLSITPGNCHVILHRARLKLRSCLESGWGRTGELEC